MDERLLLWINQGWGHPALDGAFWWLSQRLWFAFPLAALLLYDSVRRWGWRGARLFLLLALTVVVGDLLGGFLKDAFAAPRPCQAMFEELRALGGAVAERCGKAPNGMPSNHAINFFAAAAFIALATPWRGWRIGLFACAVLVGLSRIYLGKHYPSQVLAGALVGALVGALGAWLASRYPTVFRAPVVDAAGPAFHSPAAYRESDESNRS
ncbi:MAG: phosphatase PAP2 family protein [Candidatus Competibacter sp.]